jgi:hypothetical protein
MLEFVVVALAQIDGPLIVLGDTESNLVTAPADERTRAAPIAMRQHGGQSRSAQLSCWPTATTRLRDDGYVDCYLTAPTLSEDGLAARTNLKKAVRAVTCAGFVCGRPHHSHRDRTSTLSELSDPSVAKLFAT